MNITLQLALELVSILVFGSIIFVIWNGMKMVNELNGNTHAETCKGKALSTSLHVAISKARSHTLLPSGLEEL